MAQGRDEAGLVLLVDDEAEVRSVAAAILSASGFRVMQADGAESALKQLLAEAGIRLLMTDLAMPRMGGLELADVAKRIRPGLRVLFTSAHVAAEVEGCRAFRHGPLLEKPWRVPQLERQVRQLLAG